MRKESTQLTLISVSITIMALIAIIARIMMPNMMFDSVTLWLLAIAIVPWLAPLIKSIEWGGAKIEFQERLKKLETDTTNMHNESVGVYLLSLPNTKTESLVICWITLTFISKSREWIMKS